MSASLLTGKRADWFVESLLCKERWRSRFVQEGTRVALKIPITLPDLTESQRDSGLFVPVDDHLGWWLPDRVGRLLVRVKRKVEAGEVNESFLMEQMDSALACKIAGRSYKLTTYQVARGLSQFMADSSPYGEENTATGVDDAVVAAILDRSPTDYPQVSYTIVNQTEIDHLGKCFYQYLAELSSLELSWPTNVRVPDTRYGRAGSRRVLKSKVVKDRFSWHRENLEKSASSPLQYVTHFAYLLYDANCLAEISRSNNGRLYDRSLINLDLGVMYVDDKLIRGHGRTIPLAPTMVGLLGKWDALLEWVLSVYGPKYPKLAAAIKDALEGTGPYIFAIVGEDGEIQELTLDYVKDVAYSDFDVPPNWGRHFMRNALRAVPIRFDMMDEFAGHKHRSSSLLDTYSCARFSTYHGLARSIERILRLVGVSADIPPLAVPRVA